VLKLKKNNSGAKRLNMALLELQDQCDLGFWVIFQPTYFPFKAFVMATVCQTDQKKFKK